MTEDEALKSLISLPEVDRIAVARLEPEDIIVIEADRYLSSDTAKRLTEYARQSFGNRKVIVLDQGLRLKVIGQKL